MNIDMYMMFEPCTYPWGRLVKVFKSVQVYMDMNMVFEHGKRYREEED